MHIVFLGTGTSTAIPVIGCNCPVCTSPNPRNKRLRASVTVSTPATTILVDAGPDLHEQALRHHLTAITAVLYTHEHLDHVAGFDEMRAFCWHIEGRLPLYAGTRCLEQLKRMYGWAFKESNNYQGYMRPQAHDHAGKPFRIGDIDVEPVPVVHATVETYGYIFRHGGSSFAYLPDVKELPPSSRAQLHGLDAIAMDGLRYRPHPTHLNIEENAAIMQELAPKSGYITHTGHNVEYDQLNRELPPFMESAYDGLELDL